MCPAEQRRKEMPLRRERLASGQFVTWTCKDRSRCAHTQRICTLRSLGRNQEASSRSHGISAGQSVARRLSRWEEAVVGCTATRVNTQHPKIRSLTRSTLTHERHLLPEGGRSEKPLPPSKQGHSEYRQVYQKTPENHQRQKARNLTAIRQPTDLKNHGGMWKNREYSRPGTSLSSKMNRRPPQC